jgi:flagellar FliJ protein
MPVPRTFRLQPVLNLKELREEQLQVDLAARQAEEERQRQMLAALEAEQSRQLGELGRLTGGGPLDLTCVDAALSYLHRVQGRVVDQAEAAARANAATAATRDALTAAMRERKVLEKLREQQRAALRQHLRQLEANQADETAISRFARRGRAAEPDDASPLKPGA